MTLTTIATGIVIILTVILALEANHSRALAMPIDLNPDREFCRRVREIDWDDFETAYGYAAVVADQLIRLNSTNVEVAKHASHELWSGLTTQNCSAAFPAAPFILEILDSADEELTAEIMDILVGLAACSSTCKTEISSGDKGIDGATKSFDSGNASMESIKTTSK